MTADPAASPGTMTEQSWVYETPLPSSSADVSAHTVLAALYAIVISGHRRLWLLRGALADHSAGTRASSGSKPGSR